MRRPSASAARAGRLPDALHGAALLPALAHLKADELLSQQGGYARGVQRRHVQRSGSSGTELHFRTTSLEKDLDLTDTPSKMLQANLMERKSVPRRRAAEVYLTGANVQVWWKGSVRFRARCRKKPTFSQWRKLAGSGLSGVETKNCMKRPFRKFRPGSSVSHR